MPLWRDGGFAEDIWTTLDDAAPLPLTGPIIVSFPRWSAEKDTLARRADPVGVTITASKDAPAQLAEVAGRPLVALSFAKFGDGRAFSYAELLRVHHRFSGQLRAVGDVLLDSIALMQRCGFTEFEVTDEATQRALREGHLPPKRTLFYQPALGPHEAPAGTRPWLRRGT